MALESLTYKLQNVFRNLRGKGRLTESDVKAAMKEVKMALLEADVNFRVVKQFVKSVEERAIGADVMNGLNPGQMVIKIVNEEMTALMGSETTEIQMQPGKATTVIMMCGLQGAGKTTTAAKLAGKFKLKGKKSLLVACDIYRPAAIEQLEINAKKQDVDFFSMGTNHRPLDIAKAAMEHAAKNGNNVVILDTAGRLHIDEEMMQELIEIKENITVHQTLLVVDGQQRREAIRRCIAAGKLAPETPIDVILVSDDDADDTFRRLNIGVTVAKSIVGTMDYGQDSRDAVNRLATHSLFGVLGFSAYSRQNGITSAMAQGVAAMVCRYMDKDGNMVPVWDSPSSTYGDAHNALVKHADNIPADEWEKVNALFGDIQTALHPYVEFIGKYGKGKKETATARKLLSSLRKKNLFFTACDAIANGGSPAADVLAALTLTERLEAYGRNGKPYRYTATVNGKSVKLSACWTVGGGSSGSNADFEQRRIILSVIVAGMTDSDRKNGLTVTGSAVAPDVKDSTDGAVDAVMEAM